jgi:DNA-binding transcriptional MerR regulator
MPKPRNLEPTPGAELTIDDVAQRTGMTVRNLREWRTLGLLPPAEMRGRVGFYDEAIVSRIERIKELRELGFTLELIGRMLDASDGFGEDVMRLASNLRAPFRPEGGPVVDLPVMARSWGTLSPRKLRRAAQLGLIRKRADGRYEFTSARIAQVGEALNELGLSIDETLEATAEIRVHADSIAELFEQIWMRHIWQPFLDAGSPEDALPDLERTLAEVQPLATDAVVELFTVAMEAKIEEGIAREVKRAAERPPPARRERATRRQSPSDRE